MLHRGLHVGVQAIQEFHPIGDEVVTQAHAALASETPGFGRGRLEGGAELGIRAAHADRLARQAGDAGERSEEDEFLPARALDVFRLLDIDAGRLAGGHELIGAGADLQALHGAGMRDDARRADAGRDVRHARQHVLPADDSRQDLRRLDAVLERNDERALMQHRLELMRSRFHIAELHAEHDEIDGADLRRTLMQERLRHMNVAAAALDFEAVLAHRAQVCAARDEVDFVSCGGQAGAEVSPDAARTEDRDPHISICSGRTCTALAWRRRCSSPAHPRAR